MKKKIVSLLLTAMLCLALAVPAFAANYRKWTATEFSGQARQISGIFTLMQGKINQLILIKMQITNVSRLSPQMDSVSMQQLKTPSMSMPRLRLITSSLH